jgi:hypothetical protein
MFLNLKKKMSLLNLKTLHLLSTLDRALDSRENLKLVLERALTFLLALKNKMWNYVWIQALKCTTSNTLNLTRIENFENKTFCGKINIKSS